MASARRSFCLETTRASLLTRSDPVAFDRSDPHLEQDWDRGPASSSTPQACKQVLGAGRYHPRRRRAVWGTVIRSGKGERLSCRASTLEFVAEVLKVFVTDLPLLHLFDHRSEVCQ